MTQRERTPKTLQTERYSCESLLGTGTYGNVLCCLDATSNKKVAVKISHRESAYRRSALAESRVLQELVGNPDVVQHIETFEHEGRIHITLEMCHINLYEHMRNREFAVTDLAAVRAIGSVCIRAIGQCHKLGFIHCDVKPENVMMKSKHSDTDCCLIDFGAVRRFHENRYFDVQSLWYRAPEVLAGVPYTTKIDVWSLGCMLYELHTGNPLFAGNDAQEQMNLMVDLVGQPSQQSMTEGKHSGVLKFSGSSQRTNKRIEDSIVSNDQQEVDMFTDLLYHMLAPDETQRYSCEQCLSHPYFRGGKGWTGPTHPRLAYVRDQSFGGMTSTNSNSTLNSPEFRGGRVFDEDDAPGMSVTTTSTSGNSATNYPANTFAL